jgi:choline dehydrogenase-like flavoprotein
MSARAWCAPTGVHWQMGNLSVHDGSLFPTSIGANPQLSIYGIVNRLAQGLAQRTDRPQTSCWPEPVVAT